MRKIKEAPVVEVPATVINLVAAKVDTYGNWGIRQNGNNGAIPEVLRGKYSSESMALTAIKKYKTSMGIADEIAQIKAELKSIKDLDLEQYDD